MIEIIVALVSNPYVLGFVGGIVTALYAPKAAGKLWGFIKEKVGGMFGGN